MKCIAITFLIVLAASIMLPRIGAYDTETHDCDDIALEMYNHFTGLGFDVRIFIGNLAMTGETYTESNHVWLQVKTAGGWVAYDRGTDTIAIPYTDPQHYEGYEIKYDTLLAFVEYDKS
ncbi:hypothetical protein [Dehalococcoides mccartyi]|uniref:hypothetical protein n=1 Tax=Dehalococcoides mccartyi TaxID=61435 RepID=UPI0012FEEDC0|nr:hypothetical protein [Dehalococcoides mccartyi]